MYHPFTLVTQPKNRTMDDELIMRDAKCSHTGRHMQTHGTAYASPRDGICKPTSPHLATGMSMRKMRHE